MAEYKFVCIADVVPPAMDDSVGGLNMRWQSGNTFQNCPGGGVWELDTGWLEPLTVSEGSLLTAAIIGVWVVGWGARQVIRVIRR